MKAFWISLTLLVCLLGGVAGNYIYINDVFTRMNASLDRLPDLDSPDCEAACAALLEAWKKHTDTVGLSVCFNIVDRVSEQAETLRVCAACGDRFGFEVARSLLRDALEDMRRLERFSIENLL
ncbi:MAG: hypothetical protein IKB58_02230 [Oscillospiraceae bacterium]|nr:hypothetical protein [Oscillospiraceae bacterium]